MVSIIIPVYNAAQYLSACLDSIQSQNNADWEAILIDDGSTDDSLDICNSYALTDKRFRVIHKVNGGVSAARNTGIENCNGEWITFIDADDTISADFIPELLCEHIDLYVTQWQYFGENHFKEHLPTQFIDNKAFHSFLGVNAHLSVFTAPWGKFIKKKTILDNNVKFDSRFRMGEDTLFVLQIESKCNSMMIIGGIYYYRRAPYESWIKKYINSPKDSLLYFDSFLNYYRGLHVCAPRLVCNVYRNVTNITDFSSISRYKWHTQPQVIEMKSLLNKTMTPVERFKLVMIRILSLFTRHL